MSNYQNRKAEMVSLNTGATKIFKDPVHGYISVPVNICTALVDTPIFQRLRHIEQTSMRTLYPAAHHDRFIHSLGVFHLGQKVYSSLTNTAINDGSSIAGILNDQKLQNTFLVACLMHDCGHAPFSHTFENFYNYTKAKGSERVYNRLYGCFPDGSFTISGSFKPAPHEAFSAVVFKEFYTQALRDNNIDCDIELAARMITGCTYPSADTPEKEVHNQLIGLLNGDAIDVDKLDYILRDTWASGVSNASIDVERLISAMMLRTSANDQIELCYHKSALSVIQSVVDARNYLYRWIYTHHTVLYYAKLLDLSLRRAANLIFPDNPDRFWESVFSEQAFQEIVTLNEVTSIYLPTDGDILNILKSLAGKLSNDTDSANSIFINDVNEFLSHSPQRVPLWKTYAEYRHFFGGQGIGNIKTAQHLSCTVEDIPDFIARKIGKGVSPDDIIAIKAEAKIYAISEGDIRVLIDGKHESFTNLLGKQVSIGPQPMHFFVFIPRQYSDERQHLINELQKRTR